MKKVTTILLLFCLFSYHQVTSQVTEARAVLDTTEIMIGDQVSLKLELSVPSGSEIWWPEILGDTLTRYIEILARSAVDTISEENGNLQLRQTLRITSFDSGFHEVPPIPFEFKVKNDTTKYAFQTLPVYLSVNIPAVDMKADIKAIKPPLSAPITFKEILPWILIALAVLLAGAVAYYIWYRMKKNKPVIAFRPKTVIPPHVKALDNLEYLRLKKLWQSGKIKEYYSELTDIIRWYIEERYKIPALESTTDEILESLHGTGAPGSSQDKLRSTLILADLVKFAKEQPLPDQHDQCLTSCVEFVRETKPEVSVLREETPVQENR